MRTVLHLTQKSFADALGVQQSTMSTYETGYHAPTSATIKLICETFGVNMLWLTAGKGDMFRSDLAGFHYRASQIASQTDPFLRNLATLLWDLNEDVLPPSYNRPIKSEKN